jgi:lipopolysaccharide transport system ATP-binding protein
MEVIKFENVLKKYKFFEPISYKEKIFNMLKKDKKEFVREYLALYNINFSIKQGESVGIIGKNGSGKSTLLGLIAGVLTPTKGILKVNGRVSPLLELGGGFHPDLNAYENIILNGVLLGIPKKKVINSINAIIEYAEIGEFVNHPIRTYSSGMLARLGFSIVTQLEPEILLIDEVLAVGDSKFREKCINTMLEFKKKKVTIVFVSHNLEEVKTLCDRVIWIDEHTIKMDGKTDEVLNEYIKFMS